MHYLERYQCFTLKLSIEVVDGETLAMWAGKVASPFAGHFHFNLASVDFNATCRLDARSLKLSTKAGEYVCDTISSSCRGHCKFK